MKVKVIPVKKNKNIIYVPENIEYFLADDPTADVVQHLELGYENIKNRFPNLTLEEYEELNSSINKNNPNSITHIPDRQLDRLIINISNDCNMRCKYCYANQGTYGSEKNMISIECLAQTLNTIFGIFKEVGLIQLFGGEPTLNIPAIKFVGQYLLENNRKTKLGMVTNATIVNEQLIELIKKYDIKLTVSVDVERLHNDLRPFPANQPSWEKVRKNIHRLKAETGQPSQFEVTYTKLHEDAGLTLSLIHISEPTRP